MIAVTNFIWFSFFRWNPWGAHGPRSMTTRSPLMHLMIFAA
jgi:hypothetical protein